jgi:hypothetical protein
MTSEFKKIKNNEDTHYVLETATGGATSAGAVATVPGALGKVKKREDNILAQEKKETPKPRNFVAKNAKMGGAGQHKDKKKAEKQGDVKHRKPFAGQGVAEGHDDNEEEFIPQIYARVIPGTKSFLITKVLDVNLGLKVGDKVSHIALTKGKFKDIPKSLSYKQGVAEGETWSKHNNKRAGGMSKKSVASYRRSHPGSKIQTAVTTKPSKLKKGSKAAKRRASFCARMRGMKKHRTGAKTANDPNSNINKSLRRWHCESIEELQELVMLAEQFIRNKKNEL